MIQKNLKERILTSIVLLLLISFALNYNFFLVYLLIIFGVFSIIEFSNLIKKIFNNNYYSLVTITIFSIYVFILFSLIFIFFSSLFSKIIFLIILFSCIFSDIGGFLFGKILKGPKLTKISPKKTVSGSIGSLIMSSIFMISAVYFLTKKFEITILFVAIFISLGCQIGDLFFSYLKRKAGVKDTGNFLPGHGGILDRLDGIFVGLPIGFILLITLMS